MTNSQDETPEQIAERFSRSLEWAREHRGVHRCVDNKLYRVSCLVTDPTCDRVARSYMALTEAEGNRP